MPDQTPPFGHVHHVALTVSDLRRSVEWYARVLGFLPQAEVVEADGARRKALLGHPSEALRLTLLEHRDGPGDRFDETRTGLDHLSFAVAGPEALQRWAAHLDALGVAHSPVTPARLPGSWALVLRDPDHIQLELYTSEG